MSVVGRKVSLEGRRGPLGPRVRETEGERGELGGTAITGMVEGEEHRWHQETGRLEGDWREDGKGEEGRMAGCRRGARHAL